jgi:hypothetical protein
MHARRMRDVSDAPRYVSEAVASIRVRCDDAANEAE